MSWQTISERQKREWLKVKLTCVGPASQPAQGTMQRFILE